MTGDRCPDCDPILTAGHLHCQGCGSRSWPLDATWISDTTILVTYANECAHGCPRRRDPGTILFDLGSSSGPVPWVARPRMCRAVAATTRRPCKSPARPGSGYCWRHDPARRPQ